MSHDQKAQISTSLGICKNIACIVNNIIDCLVLLSNKRTTLEEKLITNYLHLMVLEYNSIQKYMHKQLADNSFIEDKIFEQLTSVNSEIEPVLAELQKMISYDLNFFEQYYEYDFMLRLTNELRLLDKLQAIAKQI